MLSWNRRWYKDQRFRVPITYVKVSIPTWFSLSPSVCSRDICLLTFCVTFRYSNPRGDSFHSIPLLSSPSQSSTLTLSPIYEDRSIRPTINPTTPVKPSGRLAVHTQALLSTRSHSWALRVPPALMSPTSPSRSVPTLSRLSIHGGGGQEGAVDVSSKSNFERSRVRC